MSFKIGDRVIYIGDNLPRGYAGTVAAFDEIGSVGVRFDKKHSYCHNLGGRCEYGYGYWCDPDNLEPEKKKREESMVKFKNGDLVLVVGPENPDMESMTDGLSWIPGGMEKMCGKVMRIISVNEGGRYELDGGDGWLYVDAWLRAYPHKEKPKFQRGDRVECPACIEGKEKGTVVGMDSFGTREGTIMYLVRLDDPSSGWSINRADKARLDLAGYGIHGDMPGGYWHARESELKRIGDKDGGGSQSEKEKGGNMAKFKVGDLVWIVGPEDPDKVAYSKECKWVPSGMKDSCGMVAEITYVTHFKGDPRYKLDYSDYYYAESWLKAYDGDTKPRFQKGDRVRKCAGMWIGNTATVMGYLADNHRYLIRYDEDCCGWAPDTSDVALLKRYGIHVSEKDGNVYWYAMEDSIEPLEESGKSEKKEKPRFKVGDRVMGNEKARGYGITKTGWVGYVTEIKDDGCISVSETMKYKYGYIVDPDAFDLCPEKDGEDPYVRRVVIEITQNGAKAKYIVGKKVEKEASIRRYHGDKPDDAKAAKFAVEALFGRLKADESAEYASRTAEALRRMDWGDILFKAFCEGTGGKK